MELSDMRELLSEMTEADLGEFLNNLERYEIFDTETDDSELSLDMFKTHQRLRRANAIWRWHTHNPDCYRRILDILNEIGDACRLQLKSIFLTIYTLCVQFLEMKLNFPRTPPNEEGPPSRPQTPIARKCLLQNLEDLSR